MNNRTAQLRVKVKSLAAEARIIRREEATALARPDLPLYRDLRSHRIGLRGAARCALLAYAVVRGVPYERVEGRVAGAPDWAEVRRVADRFGATRDWDGAEPHSPAGGTAWAARSAAQAAAFDDWFEAAGAHCALAARTPPDARRVSAA